MSKHPAKQALRYGIYSSGEVESLFNKSEGAHAPSSSFPEHDWFYFLSFSLKSLRARFDECCILSVHELPYRPETQIFINLIDSNLIFFIHLDP
jgi:hypothetical protein